MSQAEAAANHSIQVFVNKQQEQLLMASPPTGIAVNIQHGDTKNESQQKQ